MPVCVPIKDLKDTAAFTCTIQNAKGSVTVTKMATMCLLL